jgi:hypothetical protein
LGIADRAYRGTLWATGLGQTNPPGVDGQMQTNIAAKYLADVQVTVGGAPTAEQYAGPAPSFARLSQINLQIPQTKSGAQPGKCSSARRRFRRTCSYGFSRGASAPFPCSFRSTLSLNPKMCIDVDRREESG